MATPLMGMATIWTQNFGFGRSRRGTAPNMGEALSGTDMYHHPRFHADRCHVAEISVTGHGGQRKNSNQYMAGKELGQKQLMAFVYIVHYTAHSIIMFSRASFYGQRTLTVHNTNCMRLKRVGLMTFDGVHRVAP